MGRVERITIGILSLLVGGLLAVSAASAQEPQRPLRPTGAQGLPVVPYMEGWYDNGDGSVTVPKSFRAQVGDSFIVTESGYDEITHHPKAIGDVIL